jgi:hypothetical protein
MVTCRSPKPLIAVRVCKGVQIGSLVKWIITQRYGRWVKGSNPLGATKNIYRWGQRKLSPSLLNLEDENRYTKEDETQNSL